MDPSNLTASARRFPTLVFLTLFLSMPLFAQTRTSRVRIDTLANFPSRILNRSRTVRIVLPPGYRSDRGKYPVLIMNDGQDLEAMRIPQTLDSLYRNKAIRPMILVAVHATDARIQEYGVATTPNAQGFGSEAGKYAGFLLEELLPAIGERYRVSTAPASSAIMGASLGGLSAFDLAWNHSDVFGNVGVFSGSFWWRSDDATVEAKQKSRIMHAQVRETARAPKLRIWLEAGRQDERDDRDGNGVIDAIQDTRELVEELKAKGFRDGREMMLVEVDGGHNPATWGRMFPEFLRWTFRP